MSQHETGTICTEENISSLATDEIIRIRDDKGLSRSALVRQVERHDPKFSETQFWRIQTGKAAWTLDRFVYVAAALGLDPPMLLDRILRGHDVMAKLDARAGPDSGEEEGGADDQREAATGQPSS